MIREPFCFFWRSFPLLIIVTFAYEGLNLWLGSDFANNSYLVLQLLAVGVFINSLANVPFGLVQSAGRPDLTAKLHMIELPFYLLVLWWLLNAYGIVGVAIAWVLRVAVDAIILFIMANRLLFIAPPYALRALFTSGIVLFSLALGLMISEITIKWLFLLLTLLIFTAAAWFIILTTQEKCIIRNRLKVVLSTKKPLDLLMPNGKSKTPWTPDFISFQLPNNLPL